MRTRGIDRGGQFIVLEGVDGVGKSTLARSLVRSFRKEGIDCEGASFPGQEPETLAAHIYRLYHKPTRFGVRSINQSAIQLLLTAAHIETIETKILPALANGKTVVLDRFWWSTWVYGHATGVARSLLAKLLEIENLAWGDVMPTTVFLISRSTPHGTKGYSKSTFAQLSRLYRSLARQEAARGMYPVLHCYERSNSRGRRGDDALSATALDIVELFSR